MMSRYRECLKCGHVCQAVGRKSYMQRTTKQCHVCISKGHTSLMKIAKDFMAELDNGRGVIDGSL